MENWQEMNIIVTQSMKLNFDPAEELLDQLIPKQI